MNKGEELTNCAMGAASDTDLKCELFANRDGRLAQTCPAGAELRTHCAVNRQAECSVKRTMDVVPQLSGGCVTRCVCGFAQPAR